MLLFLVRVHSFTCVCEVAHVYLGRERPEVNAGQVSSQSLTFENDPFIESGAYQFRDMGLPGSPGVLMSAC